ncbi:MAG: GPW/gp25 family protein [Chloroflexi bacterium]|nr:GPW/gp25 family protein [Chloroflexota bacterium]
MAQEYLFNNNFIGAGWAFAPGHGTGVSGQGNVKLVQGDLDVAKSVFIILSTALGERVMRPEFGCGIHDLVFASPGTEVFGLVSYYIQQALERWEPRIEIEAIDVSVDQNAPECLLIDIKYKIVQINSSRNLVYPFYVIPRNED